VVLRSHPHTLFIHYLIYFFLKKFVVCVHVESVYGRGMVSVLVLVGVGVGVGVVIGIPQCGYCDCSAN